jgi:hypothetical protein
MKYRVRADMIFDTEVAATEMFGLAQARIGKATAINAGKANEEASYCELEMCGHDEGKPCVVVARTSLKPILEVAS